MTTASIKTKLHKLIDENDNPEFLRGMMKAVKKANTKKDWWDELTPEQQKSLEEASERMTKKRGSPHEVVMKRVKKWLSK